jgi:alkylation response protein AidB-like acyl-CoA dehydrogenase
LVFIYSSIFISDPSKGYKGITAFIVEKEWGVQIAKREKKVCRKKKKKKE